MYDEFCSESRAIEFSSIDAHAAYCGYYASVIDERNTMIELDEIRQESTERN